MIVEILKDEEIFLKNQTLLTSLLKRSNIARNRKTKGTKKDQKSWFFWKKGSVKLVHNNAVTDLDDFSVEDFSELVIFVY